MSAQGDTEMATANAAAPLSPAPHDDPKPTTETVASASAKPANALTPPTSEEMNHETKDSDSELSDLDLSDDEDDGEPIEPDHYWDGGKIPVFKPVRCNLPGRCSAVQGRRSMRSCPGLHVHAQIQGCVLTTLCCRQWISFATSKGSSTRSTSTA